MRFQKLTVSSIQIFAVAKTSHNPDVMCNITQAPIEINLNLKQLPSNMDNKTYFLNQLNKIIGEYNV